MGTNPCIYYLCAANAWEEGDEVVLTTCRMPGIELDLELEYKKEKAWSVNSKLYLFPLKFDASFQITCVHVEK